MQRSVVLLLICAWSQASRASVFDTFQGVRSLSMGGVQRGLGSSNDTIYLNPAGLASFRRYHAEVNYGYSPLDDITHLNVSAVDSKSGPVAGALAYTYDWGDTGGANPSLHRLVIGAAYPLAQALALGITAHHIRGYFSEGGARRSVSVYNGDVGLLANLGGSVGVGLSAHNVMQSDLARLAPLSLGAGVAYNTPLLVVAADYQVDLRQPKDARSSYHAGAEYFLAGTFPLRLGFRHRPYTTQDLRHGQESLVGGGVGWVTNGGALQVGVERSLQRPHHWNLGASLALHI